ncbi:MAG: DUF58 domain-containing protein [Alphaproteobacteria bacterium]
MTSAVTRRHGLNWQRFFRGEGPAAGPCRLHRRNLYILPTRAGLGLAVLLAVLLLGAINYSNSLGYLFTFLLGSIAVLAIVHTYRNLLGLRIGLGRLPAGFVGDTLALPVRIDNPEPRDALGIELQWPGQAPEERIDVAAGQATTAHLPLKLARRGWQPVPRFVVAGRFPLGWFRAWAHVHPDQRLLVYPRPARSAPLPPPAAWTPSLGGERGQGSDDYAGLRPYHVGDSPRHIHWKALARHQGLLTKQFGGDRCEELWLDWTTLPALPTETRLGILARWVLDAEAGGHDYGLRLPGDTIPPDRGPPHRHRCLKALALYHD